MQIPKHPINSSEIKIFARHLMKERSGVGIWYGYQKRGKRADIAEITSGHNGYSD